MEQDSNAVAAKSQLHSSTHNATCFKYGAAETGQCRFNFPRSQIAQITVSDQGTIDIKRNNVCINPWCPALASLIRSNHDIKFIPSNVKALALICYITNYATKGDCSQYQRVLGAAFVRKAYEEASQQNTEDVPSVGVVARQYADCVDGNKDIRIEATLLIPRQQAQPNQAVNSRRETALIRLYDTYKRYGSSPIDRMPRRGQIVCLGSDLNQNSNLHRMSQYRAS